MAIRVDPGLQYVPLLNLSTYNLRQKAPREALQRLQRLRSICAKRQDSPGYDEQLLAPVYYNTGIAYLQLRDSKRAVFNFRKAKMLYRQFDPIQETLCVMMEAGAHARAAPLKAIRLLEFSIVQF